VTLKMATRTLAAMVVTSVVGAESDTLPPLLAILVGGDADNTGGHSLGYVDDVRLEP